MIYFSTIFSPIPLSTILLFLALTHLLSHPSSPISLRYYLPPPPPPLPPVHYLLFFLLSHPSTTLLFSRPSTQLPSSSSTPLNYYYSPLQHKWGMQGHSVCSVLCWSSRPVLLCPLALTAAASRSIQHHGTTYFM